MILIRHNGQVMRVRSVKGYPGCEVIKNDAGPAPSEFHRFKDGKWVEDKKAKAKAMPSDERFDMLMEEIQKLSRRVEKFERLRK